VIFENIEATTLSMSRIEAAFASAQPGTLMPMISLEERDEVSHVLNRLTFGSTPELRAHVREMGVEAFIEEQLNPESIEDWDIEPYLSSMPDIEMSPFEILQKYEGMGVQRVFQ
jgi:hypothetical protein